jgi:hypothetical protein
MTEPLRTTLRIPGTWAHPGELLERLPEGFRLTPESLTLPDGTSIEFIPMAPDNQFPDIFRSSCRRPPAQDELDSVANYTVNIGLTGPAGSIDAAATMLQAGAAIVRAGGAGVFIDNSGLAHGGGDWLEMADDSGPDAISFAFAAIISGDEEVWTMGMNVMGLPDVVMRAADLAEDGDEIIEVIRYLCRGEKPVGPGHLLADESGPRFQALAADGDDFPATSPMHNPNGRLKLVHVKDIAEGN